MVVTSIDLISTPDGEVVMLEVNPNGQWAFVQSFTGLPIAGAPASLLKQLQGGSTMKHGVPFGLEFARKVEVPCIEVPYDPATQTAALSDQELERLAACDNTLTGTAGPDNDFDD
jgi:hypothetical protein